MRQELQEQGLVVSKPFLQLFYISRRSIYVNVARICFCFGIGCN